MRRLLFGLVLVLTAAAGCRHTAAKPSAPVVEEYPLPPGVK